MRMKAFFNTVALVTVHIPDFFDYQDVAFIEDKILNLKQFTKENRRPPLVFWTTAWATTMQTWSDEIRTSGKTLSVLTKETATWTPPWLSWDPTPTGSSPDASTAPRHRRWQRQGERAAARVGQLSALGIADAERTRPRDEHARISEAPPFPEPPAAAAAAAAAGRQGPRETATRSIV